MKDLENTNNTEISSFQLREIYELVAKKWYWFLISIVVCLALSMYFFVKQPAVFNRSATILIKESNKDGATSELSAFSDLGLMGSTSSVDNEVYILRSRRLMSAVIEKLDLNVEYTAKPRLRIQNIHAYSSLKMTVSDNYYPWEFTVEITPISPQKFHASYSVPDQGTGKFIESVNCEYSFGDSIAMQGVKFVVEKTDKFNSEAIGSTITADYNPQKKILDKFVNSMNVSRVDKMSGVVVISMRDNSSKRATDIVNNLITTYNEDAISEKNQIARNTEQFILDRLTKIGEELGGVDTEIEKFKRTNQITDISTTSELFVKNSSDYNREALQIQTQINLVNFIKEYLTNPAKANELIPSNVGISDPGVQSQINDYNQTKLSLDKMLLSSGENNPMVRNLSKSLASLGMSINDAVNNYASSLNIQLKNIKGNEGIMNSRIASIPSQEKEVINIVRQQKIKEELYLYLLNKREENALSLAITESNARIIDTADGANIPVSPKLIYFLIAGLIAGCLIPVSVIYFMSLFDTKVRGRSDIERNTSIPVLGEIPSKPKNRKTEELLVAENGHDSISEAFQILRSNLDMLVENKTSGATVVMSTSTMAAEGKTYMTTNLAMSFAFTDKRVLLIDLDVRKGTLTKNISEAGKVGVTNWLLGKVEKLDSIISRSELHPFLDVIHSGPVPPNPVKLLMGERLDMMIDQLRGRYDYIFIDAVPAMIVADSAIINRVADATIYVVREGVLDRRTLPFIEKIHTDNKFKNMSIVVTDASISNLSYGYGYGYGYGSVEQEKKDFGKTIKKFLRRK